jgi:hypothetical protein
MLWDGTTSSHNENGAQPNIPFRTMALPETSILSLDFCLNSLFTSADFSPIF